MEASLLSAYGVDLRDELGNARRLSSLVHALPEDSALHRALGVWTSDQELAWLQVMLLDETARLTRAAHFRGTVRDPIQRPGTQTTAQATDTQRIADFFGDALKPTPRKQEPNGD